ncbi:MAG: hypothetical protein KAX49_20205 [Halanaerobiales bacterium]|nr:hypothetical protein [Halanaerobiales bacterium]
MKILIRNTDLYGYVKDLMTFCITLLKRQVETGTISFIYRIVRSFKIESDTSMNIFSSTEIDFYKTVSQINKNIKESTQFNRCLEIAIKEVPQPRELKLPFQKFIEDRLIYFLSQYMEVMQRLEFNEDVFKNFYLKFETYLYEHTEQRKYLLFLQNFDMEIDEILLNKFMRIRKFSIDEVQELYGLIYKHVGTPMPSDDRCLIEKICITRIGEPLPDPYEDFKPVMKALRLFKSGRVMRGDYADINLTWYPEVFAGLSYRRFGGVQYKLTKQDAECFRKFWTKHKEPIQFVPRLLNTALQIFYNSYYIDEPRHRLINIITSFESLLLKDSEAELSLRLALRTSVFLEKNKHKRKDIFDNMRKAYRLRNKIVHGGEEKTLKKLITKLGMPLNDFVIKIENYLRQCLQKFLIFKTPDYKVEKLDDKIFA